MLTPDIVSKLRSDPVRKLVARRDFDSLYDQFSKYERPAVTELFQELKVNLLDHLKGEFVPSFSYCSNQHLKLAKIPSSIVSIGECAFMSSEIEAVDFTEANKLYHIEKDAFESSNIKSLIFPNSLHLIDSFAFYECNSLESVRLSSNITKIGMACFAGCESLSYLYLPRSTPYIGKLAFEGCGYANGLTIEFGGTVGEFRDVIKVSSGTAFQGTSITVKCSNGELTYTTVGGWK